MKQRAHSDAARCAGILPTRLCSPKPGSAPTETERTARPGVQENLLQKTACEGHSSFRAGRGGAWTMKTVSPWNFLIAEKCPWRPLREDNSAIRPPRKYRSVFVLRDVGQFTIKETADALGVSHACVKTFVVVHELECAVCSIRQRRNIRVKSPRRRSPSIK
jgi:Sigma-70, region 4